MAVVKAFKARRPKPEFAREVACVPYDVVNTEEARKLAEGKEMSFLHVIRPEIDLAADISVYDDKVYEKGRENLNQLLDSDNFIQEQSEALYIYRLIREGRSQAGIFGCVSVQDYDDEVILKHELTRPAKEDDRTRHILTQQAHAEPVMFTFRDTGNITALMNDIMENEEPIYDLTANDGVQHTIWKVDNTGKLSAAFEKVPHLYVADGHHRCASASRAAKELKQQHPNHTGDEEYNFFPAVLFPVGQMKILAYNRIVYSLPESFMATLSEKYELEADAEPAPANKGRISLFYEGSWYAMNLPESKQDDAASTLDVSRLQEFILEPLLSISDQRTDSNIDFVGGIRGTETLETLVNEGKAELGISIYPTSIEELLEVSDEGLLMPPKSTWFEPKLRSGLLVHTF